KEIPPAARPAAALAPPAAAEDKGETVAIRSLPSAAAATPSATAAGIQVSLEGKFQSFVVGAGDHDVGRVPECVIRIESPQISRRHAILHVAGREASVEDLKSANGTFVNGKRISARHPLADGDTVQFGDLAFRVRMR